MPSVESIDPNKATEAAKDWGKTIAGVLSAGGIVAILQGGNTISDLTAGSQWLLAAMLVGALVCAVAAVLLAFDVAWRNLEAADQKREGVRHINASIVLTIIALALLASTAYPLLNGKVDSSPEYLVRFDDQSVVCGEMTRTATGLQIEGRDLAGVAAISEATSCPG